MIIYKTTNLINGKFYVGKDEKNKPDYLGSGINLQRAIKKYGKENFIKETLEVCLTREELVEREKYWIKETKAQKLGYNIADGGWGGNTYTEETKQRISQFFKGRYISPETIEKRKQTRAKNPEKYKLSEERKKSIGDFHRGKNNYEKMKTCKNYSLKFSEKKNSVDYNNPSGETRKKQSKAHKKNPIRYWLGKKQPKEMVEKRRQKQIGKKRTEETKEKMRGENNSFYGQTHTLEAKEKIRKSKINKTAEQMLETYIKFHISRMGYEPSEEQKLKKLEEYRKKKC